MKKYLLLKLLPVVFAAAGLCACSTFELPGVTFERTVGAGEITVTVPAALQVLAVDGRPVKSPSLYQGVYELKLEPGLRRLTVQYFENWNAQDEAGYMIQWPMVDMQHVFSQQRRYRLDYARPISREQARQMGDDPNVWLTDNGERVTAQLTIDSSVSTLRTKRMPAAKAARQSQRQQEGSVLNELKRLWQDASAEDKKAFWEWVELPPVD